MAAARLTITVATPRWRMALLWTKVGIARALAWAMWRCGVRRYGVHLVTGASAGAVKRGRVNVWPTVKVRIVPWSRVEFFKAT